MRSEKINVYLSKDELHRIQEISMAIDELDYDDPAYDELMEKFRPFKGLPGARLTPSVFARAAALSMCDYFDRFRKDKRLTTTGS